MSDPVSRLNAALEGRYAIEQARAAWPPAFSDCEEACTREEVIMSYSMITMRQALKEVGTSKGVDAFVWEKPGQAINPHLAAKFKYGRVGESQVP